MARPFQRDPSRPHHRSAEDVSAHVAYHTHLGHGRVVEHHGHIHLESELERTLAGLLRRLRLPYLAAHAGRRPALALFTILNACISIALIASIAIFTGTAFLFPSLGPTAFLVFYSPSAPAASPRNTLVGQSIAVAAGYLSLRLTRVHRTGPSGALVVDWPHVLAAMIALGLTVGLMVLLNVEHPPAASSSLLIGLGALHDPAHLALLLLAVFLVVLQALLLNRFAGVDYPLWSPRPPQRLAAGRSGTTLLRRRNSVPGRTPNINRGNPTSRQTPGGAGG